MCTIHIGLRIKNLPVSLKSKSLQILGQCNYCFNTKEFRDKALFIMLENLLKSVLLHVKYLYRFIH